MSPLSKKIANKEWSGAINNGGAIPRSCSLHNLISPSSIPFLPFHQHTITLPSPLPALPSLRPARQTVLLLEAAAQHPELQYLLAQRVPQ